MPTYDEEMDKGKRSQIHEHNEYNGCSFKGTIETYYSKEILINNKTNKKLSKVIFQIVITLLKNLHHRKRNK